MAAANGRDLPILIAGGGIGGLAAAYALARRGVAVRVLEQAPEFKELGAGIQLGPNIFRALDRIGLKEAVLADAHRPGAMEMRCALSGEQVIRIPLDTAAFAAHFQAPYAVTHRADIHAAILRACAGSNLVALENNRQVEGYEEDADGVTVALTTGERVRGRAVIGCDGMWSKSASARRRRQAAGALAFLPAPRLAQCDAWRPWQLDAVRGRAAPICALSRAAARASQPGRPVPLTAIEGWNVTRRRPARSRGPGSAAEVLRDRSASRPGDGAAHAVGQRLEQATRDLFRHRHPRCLNIAGRL